MTTNRISKKLSPQKLVALGTAVTLGAVHVFLLARGQKPPVAVDQALIAAIGALFAPTVGGEKKKELPNEAA